MIMMLVMCFVLTFGTNNFLPFYAYVLPGYLGPLSLCDFSFD